MSTFQENLKKYRERLNITAKDFATKVGIKYGTYISYETAGKEPKYDTLIKIAAALHVSIDDLLGYQLDRLGYWTARLKKAGFEVNTRISNASGECFTGIKGDIPLEYGQERHIDINLNSNFLLRHLEDEYRQVDIVLDKAKEDLAVVGLVKIIDYLDMIKKRAKENDRYYNLTPHPQETTNDSTDK